MRQLTRIYICVLAIAFMLTNMAYAANESRASTQFSLKGSPSLLIGSGGTIPGINLQVAGRFIPNVPLDFTAEVGPYYTSKSVGAIKVSGLLVPILFGASYAFEIPDSRLTPALGASLGAVIVNAKVSGVELEGQSIPLAANDTGFGIFLNPGLNFELSQNLDLNFEPRLGAIASNFVFSPQLGVKYIF